MSARTALDDDLALPGYMAAAIGIRRIDSSQARCRTGNDELGRAWKVYKNEMVDIGGTTIKGSKLVELAVAECRLCPVQWDCCRFACEVGEQFNTWSMDIDDLKVFQNREDWREQLEFAEAAGETTQAMAQRLACPVVHRTAS